MGTAIDDWKRRVEAHHAQSERAKQQAVEEDDFWRPLASRFRADPCAAGDPELNRMARWVTRETTVLDVGGGAGRLALPLARQCGRVTVVEPSESMVGELREGAERFGVQNLSVVQATWEEADVDPADLVLCAHVVYGAADVAPFVRKLETHALERVAMLVFADPPLHQVSRLWVWVHGEPRVELPALPEMMSVLWDMGIYPDLEMLEASNPRGSVSRGAELERFRRLLFVRPGTDRDARLRAAVDEVHAAAASHGPAGGPAKSRGVGLISWRPTRP